MCPLIKIQTIEGGQKRYSPLEDQHKKKKLSFKIDGWLDGLQAGLKTFLSATIGVKVCLDKNVQNFQQIRKTQECLFNNLKCECKQKRQFC